MHRKGHTGINMIAYAPIIAVLLLIDDAFIAVAAFGLALALSVAMLPDIDIKISSIKHRGPTHTVWFAIGMGIITSLFLTGVLVGLYELGSVEHVESLTGFALTPRVNMFIVLFGGFSVSWGVTSHFIGDIITPMGLRPFKPVKNTKYTFDLVLAANKTANWLCYVFGYIAIGVAFLIGSSTAREALIGIFTQYF